MTNLSPPPPPSPYYMNNIKEESISANAPKTPVFSSNLPKKEELPKNSHGSYVKLTDTEYKTLADEYGKDRLEEMIGTLNDYIASTGKKYKDFAATLRLWFKRERKSIPSKEAQEIEQIIKENKECFSRAQERNPELTRDIKIFGYGIKHERSGKDYAWTLNPKEFKESLKGLLNQIYYHDKGN